MSWERTRSFFPVTESVVYLNHAGVAPVSTRAAEALERYLAEATRHGADDYVARYEREIERVRGRCARLIGASPDEVAFVQNTTEGLGIVASGLDWRRGDRVVTCDLEYPSNVLPWKSLAPRGVETLVLRGVEGRLPLDSVAEALRSPATRLLALSSVEFGSGARNDLARLGELCREHGVLLCVDAIQSVGCLDLDVSSLAIDFLAADGHKWMLSVEGCGVFYCARRLLEQVTPRVVGWSNVASRGDYDRYDLTLSETATRFEAGSPNTGGIFALGGAVDLLLELGVPAIEERVLDLSEQLVEGLARRGARVLGPRGPGEASPIVSFVLGDEAPEDTVVRLRERGFLTACRRGGVRASPHFYNTPAELDALLETL